MPLIFKVDGNPWSDQEFGKNGDCNEEMGTALCV